MAADTDININFQGILQGVGGLSSTPSPSPNTYQPKLYGVLRSEIGRYLRGEISHVPYTLGSTLGKHTHLKTYRANSGLLLHFVETATFLYSLLPSGVNTTKVNYNINTDMFYVNLPSNPTAAVNSSLTALLAAAELELAADSIFGCGLSPNCYCNEYASQIISVASGVTCSAIIAGVIGFEALCNAAIDIETLGFGAVICVAAGAAMVYVCQYTGSASIGAALQSACNSSKGHTCSQKEVNQYMCSWV